MNALSAQPRCLAAGRVDSTAAAAAGRGVHGVSDDAARSSRRCKYSSKEMGRCCSMLLASEKYGAVRGGGSAGERRGWGTDPGHAGARPARASD